MEATLEDRLAVASSLILQSPPGEVNDVFNDVRPIVGDDAEIERGLLPALTQYNLEQLALVELPNSKVPAMICPAARLETSSDGNRYLDPHTQQTFTFDHLRLTATDIMPFTPDDQEVESLRSELDREAERYLKSHFHSAVWSVFSISNRQKIETKSTIESDEPIDKTEATQVDESEQTSDELQPSPDHHLNPHQVAPVDEPKNGLETDSKSATDRTDGDEQADDANHASQPTPTDHSRLNESSDSSHKFELYIVGNKYNPTNYWTGRWRSIYEIDLKSNQIRGRIYVNVHYYEQGNVQLATNHSPVIDLNADGSDRPSTASRIMEAIKQVESKYQTNLNSAYTDLGDNTFKQLRRALPLTKQKVNWTNMKTKIVLDEN